MVFSQRHLCLLLFLLSSSTIPFTNAKVFLNSLFSPGMVLQTRDQYGQRPMIYGFAEPGEVITVNLTINSNSPSTYTAVTNTSSQWTIQLNPENPSKVTDVNFFQIIGSSEPSTIITISPVYFGEVFLCSGQSNMVFSVMGAFNGTEIAQRGEYPNMRLFAVAEGGNETEQPDFPQTEMCHWIRTPAPSPENSSYTCNKWQRAVPNVTDYFSALCFFSALEIADKYIGNETMFGLIYSAFGGTAVNLWTPIESYDSCNVTKVPSSTEEGNAAAATSLATTSTPATAPPPPASLFNAMIKPIVGYSIRTVLWMQGENDASDTPGVYTCLFNAMIEGWRRRWRIGDFSFIYVQLAPTFSASAFPDYSWFNIRNEQASAQPMAGGISDGTGMSVALDLGDPDSPYMSVHVRNKTEEARRLALQVMHVAYALQYPTFEWLQYRGPIGINATRIAPAEESAASAFDSATAAVSVRITFDTLEPTSSIVLQDTAKCWDCCKHAQDTFQFTTENGTGGWVNSTVVVVDSHTVVATPVEAGAYFHIRYAPGTFPQCTVFDVMSQIPAAPFFMNITGAGRINNNNSGSDDMKSFVSQSNKKETYVRMHEEQAQRIPVAKFTENTWVEWKGINIDTGRQALAQLLVNNNTAISITAATPPMGFNAWNAFHTNVDENLIRKVADIFVSSGLSTFYQYVNIDDGWQVSRLPSGQIVEDPSRFPSGMKALADYIHSKGLKFGLYTAQGSITCQDRPGAYGYELQDSAWYCAIGLDYLKIDLCGGTSHPQLNTSWTLFKQGFQTCVSEGGRPIVESVEYCRDASCGVWIKDVANVWRTTGDIQDTWTSVLSNLDLNNAMAPFAGPGGWNDPDMLQVGSVGLTFDESISHFSAWCIIAAPLLISVDLVSGVDNNTMMILSNSEVIAVNQDPLGVQGIRVSDGGVANITGTECWAKPLADGSVSAMFLNRGESTEESFTCTWQEMGLKSTVTANVRDLWQHQDLGLFTGSYTAIAIPSHGVKMFKITPKN